MNDLAAGTKPPLISGARGAGAGWYGAALFILAALALVARWLMQSRIALPECGWKTFFGWPCPFCGSTRAWAALARLDVMGAVRFNPAAVLGFALAAGASAAGWWKREWRMRLAEGWERASSSGWVLALGGILLAANWVYLFWYLPR